MKRIQWPFLLLALGAVACMMGTGIAISYRSPIWFAVTFLAFIFIMGMGFKTKKKWRESGRI